MSSRCKKDTFFTLWTSTSVPPWTRCEAYITLRSQPAFYNIPKLNLYFKTYISKTTWVNVWDGRINFGLVSIDCTLEGVIIPKKNNSFYEFSWLIRVCQGISADLSKIIWSKKNQNNISRKHGHLTHFWPVVPFYTPWCFQGV